MPAAVRLRDDYDSDGLRKLAGRSKDARQARRLLSLAAVYEGKSREEAADCGGMDRQSLRDWVHAFNAHGPDGLINRVAPGRPPKLNEAQREELGAIVAKGPDLAKDGIVRWRLSDLKGVIKERFAVDLDEVSVGRLIKKLGFAHVSAMPINPIESMPQSPL